MFLKWLFALFDSTATISNYVSIVKMCNACQVGLSEAHFEGPEMVFEYLFSKTETYLNHLAFICS